MVGKTGDRIARSPQAVTHNRGGILVLCFFCWALPLAVAPLLSYHTAPPLPKKMPQICCAGSSANLLGNRNGNREKKWMILLLHWIWTEQGGNPSSKHFPFIQGFPEHLFNSQMLTIQNMPLDLPLLPFPPIYKRKKGGDCCPARPGE